MRPCLGRNNACLLAHGGSTAAALADCPLRMANLWVYGAHQGHCYSGVTENLCVRRRKPTDTTEILTISKHSVVTPTAGSAAGYQTKPAALSRCHLNRPLTRSDKSHSRGCSDIKKRLCRLNQNDLNKLFSLLRSNFARMKTRQKGGC